MADLHPVIAAANQRRKQREMTNTALADAAGIKQARLSGWFRGDRHPVVGEPAFDAVLAVLGLRLTVVDVDGTEVTA